MALATTLLASTTVTASGHTDTVTNVPYRGVLIIVDVTSVSGTSPKMTLNLSCYDAASEQYIDLATLELLASEGQTSYLIYPIADAAYPVLPGSYCISYTILGADPSFTFSIGANYLL